MVIQDAESEYPPWLSKNRLRTSPYPTSMSENPYQVRSDEPPPMVADAVSGSQGLYRKGKLLVVVPNAIFPDRCIKCNEPTSHRLKRSLSWHTPALYLLVIASPIIYIIAALLMRKRTEVQVPLAARYLAKRRTNMLVAVSLLLVGAVAFGFGVAMIESQEPNLFNQAGILMLVGPILWFIASLWGILGCRVISPKYIDDRHAQVEGVCEEFLAMLPPWS